MRQAIVTKYLGPTDFRGARIKATASAGSITIPYDSALDIEVNHFNAARALANKFQWKGKLIGGGLPEKFGGNVYVFAE